MEINDPSLIRGVEAGCYFTRKEWESDYSVLSNHMRYETLRWEDLKANDWVLTLRGLFDYSDLNIIQFKKFIYYHDLEILGMLVFHKLYHKSIFDRVDCSSGRCVFYPAFIRTNYLKDYRDTEEWYYRVGGSDDYPQCEPLTTEKFKELVEGCLHDAF